MYGRRRIDQKKFLRFILILALIAALTFGIISSLMSREEKTLKIGLSESSRPLTYVDDKKNISGFEAEYAKMLADAIGKRPEIKLYAPEDMAAALDSGAVDCIVSVRQSVHDYIAGADETDAFISYGLVFVRAPADETLNGEDDIRGRQAGLIINSDAEQLCDELLSRYSFNVRLYDFEAQPFQDLILKKNDFVIADEVYARYMQKEDPDNYLVLDTVYNLSGYGVRLSRKLSRQTVNDIKDAVYALRSEIALKDLYLRWFGADLGL